MSKSEQWDVPEDPDEYLAWIKKFHKRWRRDSDIETLRNIIITSDGLGPKAQETALNILIEKLIKNS